ncbi:hypothetical protein Micbo1qcDRAFT_156866, partial [Microdochium bolleyi]
MHNRDVFLSCREWYLAFQAQLCAPARKKSSSLPRPCSFSASCSSKLRNGSFSSGPVPALPCWLAAPGLGASAVAIFSWDCCFPSASPPCHAAGDEYALVGIVPNIGSPRMPTES